MRAFKFRMYPSKAIQKKMQTHLWLSKQLWNEMLAFTKELYAHHAVFPTKRSLREIVKGTGLHSQVAQELVDRLSDAVERKITMKKQGIKAGFPRFKSIDQMKSLVYPQSGFTLHDKKLFISPFGEINIKKHREMNGTIKTLTIKREASGKWFAIFAVEELPSTPMENNGAAVGIDFGLKNLATFSDGTTIKNPRHILEYEEKLISLQKRLSKKKKGSSNRKRIKQKLARAYEKLKNSRSDFLHKLSNQLVHSHSLIALEDLSIQHMVQEKFGKSIHDVAWNSFTHMLCYKAPSAGCKVVLVNPRNTTKACSQCGSLSEKKLSDRIHACPFCGLTMDRDINAAINILTKATAGTAESYASGDRTIVLSRKEDATCFSAW